MLLAMCVSYQIHFWRNQHLLQLYRSHFTQERASSAMDGQANAMGQPLKDLLCLQTYFETATYETIFMIMKPGIHG